MLPKSRPLHAFPLYRQRLLRALAAALLPLALAACNGGDGDDDDEPVAVAPPPAEETPPPAETQPPRNTAYLEAKPGDVIQVRIEELHPTQAAIGYDQIYYKLGRWQGDFERPTWADKPVQQLDYLNRTVGKKFDDYCEDMGGTERAQAFQTIAEARAARLDLPATYACKDAPGTHAANLKTVVVGWDGNLYLTDGHHTFSSLREIADGGPKLPVWVKVDANYSSLPNATAFWQRMVDERRAWLRDGQNQPITVDQLPARLGLPNAQEAGGMQEDRYRSLVYFTRDIAYSNGNLPEFAEFLWGDWLRRQAAGGQLPGLDQYKMMAPALPAQILAVSTLDKSLAAAGANDSYAAAVRDASLKMAALKDTDIVFGDRDAAGLGRIALAPDAASGSPTKKARDTLEELPRNDAKADGSPRGAGKLWFAVNYRNCGKPAAGSCWGW
ncbi:ParB/Srx family N-terminal domain-containing protein [Achromobacter insolitus]|uniref:ParB/Srx family N-terminal domain-containing protein n=1 Tax=Achromobacter TaxID=222 RepID=UPI0007C774DC|nr:MULTISPECIES: ParB/Srx family N-terminal domain-containing protein [Achromobacter]AXA71721.1 chromosome partitioning protein ParB [Achromobacter insolitus]MDH3062841.1 ParB/Srx family N-terminal domain-containing protein [Achromobacter insolitus]MEB3097937.1 ParB/Srx family N-terminal domain-containing protein [Achromobacter sp. D10]OAE63903.1 chromosome partitioning protein ParB [Achromobacter insolitus]OCZ59799.1 chromosome partitioning protein ParB [Achromobacter insolitus]